MQTNTKIIIAALAAIAFGLIAVNIWWIVCGTTGDTSDTCHNVKFVAALGDALTLIGAFLAVVAFGIVQNAEARREQEMQDREAMAALIAQKIKESR